MVVLLLCVAETAIAIAAPPILLQLAMSEGLVRGGFVSTEKCHKEEKKEEGKKRKRADREGLKDKQREKE